MSAEEAKDFGLVDRVLAHPPRMEEKEANDSESKTIDS